MKKFISVLVFAALFLTTNATNCDLYINSYDTDQKMSMVKAVKSVLNIGLPDAKTLVEKVPTVFVANVTYDSASVVLAKLNTYADTIDLKIVASFYFTGTTNPYTDEIQPEDTLNCTVDFRIASIPADKKTVAISAIKQYMGWSLEKATAFVDSLPQTLPEVPIAQSKNLMSYFTAAGAAAMYFPHCDCETYDIKLTQPSVGHYAATVQYMQTVWNVSLVASKDSIDQSPITLLSQIDQEASYQYVDSLLKLGNKLEAIEVCEQTAISQVSAEQLDMNSPVVVYSLLGERLAEGLLDEMKMPAGVYILRQGNFSTKVMLW